MAFCSFCLPPWEEGVSLCRYVFCSFLTDYFFLPTGGKPSSEPEAGAVEEPSRRRQRGAGEQDVRRSAAQRPRATDALRQERPGESLI